jgi:MtN3 and saliva related transmembrane protein
MHALLGVVAGTWAVAMAVSPLLQVREIVRRRSSAGLSIRYLAVLLVGFALWLAYGVAGGDLPLIIPNVLALVVMSFTITVAWRLR